MPSSSIDFSKQEFPTSVKQFFDKLSSEYDQSIQRLIPHYQEIFEALVTLSFLDKQAPLKVLELGSGSGNLSLFVAHFFPKAELTLVDLSPEMLAQARAKSTAYEQRMTFLQANILELELPENQYDLVISSFALHHLLDGDKQKIYQQIYRWLKPGGLLRIADGTVVLPLEKADQVLAMWMDMAKAAGASDAECQFWIEHHTQHDHFSSLNEHFQWLSQAGFINADCYWKNLNQAVYGAQKAI